MASAISLYLDEHIYLAVAQQLIQRGIDVVTVRDLNQLGDSDANHLERAAAMGRILCTYDRDFLRLHHAGVEHAGIVIGQSKHSIGDWVKGLELICAAMTPDEMQNHIEYL